MDGSRPPDIYDVARLAGVSHQTVSRVINNATNVRPATRDRVLEAIAALGYRRNRAARALVTRRSSTIGVMTSGSNLWGPSGALLGVERAAREAGYFVSLASLGTGDGEVADAMGHFRDQAVDGVIVIAPEAAMAHAADPLVAEVPVVMVAAGAEPSDRVMIISVDQELGARRATRHLVGLGHTRIGHVAGAAGMVRRDRQTTGLADGVGIRRADAVRAVARRLDGGERLSGGRGTSRTTPIKPADCPHRGVRGQRPDGPRTDQGVT